MTTFINKPALTPRQTEILALLAKGASNQDVADRLGISINTVKVHLAGLFKTLGANNRTEAVFQYQQWFPETESSKAPTVSAALALFPLDSSGLDPKLSFLAHGIAEDLGLRLSGWRWFPLISFEAAAQWTAHIGNPHRIRQELGARYMLTGSVRSHKQHLRVLLRLTATDNGQTEWAQVFESPIDDVFSLQKQISRRIVAALMPELLRAEHVRESDPLTLDSWSNTLRGLHHLQKRRPEACNEAMVYFRHALEQSPDYALAHYGIAIAQHYNLTEQWAAPTPAQLELLHRHAQLAMQYEPLSAFSKVAMAVSYLAKGNLDESIQNLQDAIRLNPSLGQAYNLLGLLLALNGHPDEGLSYLEECLLLSPGTLAYSTNLAFISMVHFGQGNYLKAIERCNEGLRLGSASNLALAVLVASYAMLEDSLRMQNAAQRLREQQPDFCLAALAPILRGVMPPQREAFLSAMQMAGFL